MMKYRKRSAPNPRCNICNLFMSWADVKRGVAWTPFGGRLDDELPDEEFAHRKCWKNAEERTRSLIRRFAWIPPALSGKLA